MNTSNICIFEGRMTSNTKSSQVNGPNGPIDKVTFSVSVPKVLTQQQRQAVKNGDQTIKQVDFVNFTAIGAKAKYIQQYFPAGTPIKVVAHYSTWESTNQQTGQKQYGHNFEVEDVGFVSTPSQNQGNNNGGGYQQNNNQNYQQQQGNYQQNNNGYQQNNQQNYQQPAQQQQQQNNFEMFSESDYPF